MKKQLGLENDYIKNKEEYILKEYG